jgi:hypothetical protein
MRKLAALGLLSELLSAIQNEIQRHNLSTFMSKEHKIVQTEPWTCRPAVVIDLGILYIHRLF